MHDGRPRRKREKGIASLLEEIMAKIFPNLRKKMNIQIQAAQQTPTKIIPASPTYSYAIITYCQNCEEHPESNKRKVTEHMQWSSYKMISRYLSRNLNGQKGARLSIQSNFKKKEKNPLPAKKIPEQNCHSKMKEKLSFPDKQKLRELITSRPTLQRILKCPSS